MLVVLFGFVILILTHTGRWLVRIIDPLIVFHPMISWLKKDSEIVIRQQDNSSTHFSVAAVGSDGRSKRAAACFADLFLCATWFWLTYMIWSSWIAAIQPFEHQTLSDRACMGFVGLSQSSYLAPMIPRWFLTAEVCSYDLHWWPHRFHEGQEQGFHNRCLVCWTEIGGRPVWLIVITRIDKFEEKWRLNNFNLVENQNLLA